MNFRKIISLFFFLLVASTELRAQRDYIDSLKHELEINQNDTMKLVQFIGLSQAYEETKPDTAFYYSKMH